MTVDVPGGTTEQYDRLKELAGIAAEAGGPAGLIAHACGVTDEGIVLVGVWDSERSLGDFVRNRLEAALAGAGMPEGKRRTLPLHDLIFGTGKEPNALVLFEALGLTIEAYDAIVAKMPSHAGRGETHPSVMHAAAFEPDGVRIADLWDSEEAYREFVQSQLLPAVDDPRHFVLRVWPVHDCVLARPRAHA
jgi:hypothetical protein